MVSPTEENLASYKILLVGDAHVGKTHILTRYVRGTLPSSPESTIGVDFTTKMVKLADGSEVKTRIWDTAGQEKYRSVMQMQYRKAVGALLVYDVTNLQSFANAARWLEALHNNAEPDIVIALVGNKVDLAETDSSCRQITTEKAAEYARANGLTFRETSAVTTKNVPEVFQELVETIHLRFNDPNTMAKIDDPTKTVASAQGGLRLDEAGQQPDPKCCEKLWAQQ